LRLIDSINLSFEEAYYLLDIGVDEYSIIYCILCRFWQYSYYTVFIKEVASEANEKIFGTLKRHKSAADGGALCELNKGLCSYFKEYFHKKG